jgi:hypothetical protein
MFFFVVGLPGCFSQWCDTVAARLAERAFGPTTIIHANTLEELSLGVMKSGAHQAVIGARQPRGSLRRALVNTGQGFVVALDDPRIALADLILGQGTELAAAIRAVAGSCAAVHALVSLPETLTLQSDRDWSPAATTASAIARHLQITVGDSDAAELTGTLRTGGALARHDAIAWWNSLEAGDRDTVTGALAPYVVDDPENSEIRPTSWTPDLFLLGDRPGQPATGAIDITGRPRCLMHGPYIMLPMGRWNLSLKLRFSREAADHHFSVEVLAGAPLASRTVRPPAEGILEVDLVFAVDEQNDDPISIRLSNERPAFDGVVTLIGATLVRQTEAAIMPAAIEAAS